MLPKNFIIIIAILLFGFKAIAQVNLDQLHYLNLTSSKYQITLTLDQQTDFEIVPNGNKLFVDLQNTKFAVKKLPSQLDGKFIKNVRKISKNDNLRMIFELAEGIEFDRSYFVVQADKLFITVEFRNNKIIPTSVILRSQELSKLPEEANKKYLIMIDPGHGGIDTGAEGVEAKTLEKQLVLTYAYELSKELSKYPQYKVTMTRDKDVYMSLSKRQQKAQKMKADLFISIHADFHEDPKMYGASVYTLSQEAMNLDNLVLSERENKENILKDEKILEQNKEIANVLIGMVYQDTKNASINLAQFITEDLRKEVQMMEKSHRSAGLKVLKGVDTPAILIELGYLSNKEEEKLLNSYGYRKRFIRALVQGVNKYTENSNKSIH